jgi:nucleoside-diphosphate-sugar epimerase
MNSCVLISGASGFIGRMVSAKVMQLGFAVIGVGRNRSQLFNGVEQLVVEDISGLTDWGDALQGIDVVIHLAARVHVMHETKVDPLKAFRSTNVDATLKLARQSKVAGVKRFLFLSSIGVNGPLTQVGQAFSETDQVSPHNPYAVSKCEAEQGLMRIAQETGLEVVIIRPPLVYGYKAPGNFGSLVHAVQRGWPLPLGAVNNQRSLVGLDNLVDFIITCITHPKAANQTFLVSDGQDLSTTELVRGIAQAAGVPVRLLPLPVWALQTGATLLGKGEAVQRLCCNLQVDISKARSLLGWVPPVSVEEGLRRAMAV